MLDWIFNDNSAEIEAAKKLAVEQALTQMGDTCATYASGLAPVDTGNLKRSIEKKVSIGEEAVYVGTNVDYAIYQEFGTERNRAANGGKGYIRPAVQEHIDEYKDIAQSAISNALK